MINKKIILLLLYIPYYASPTIIWNGLMDPFSAGGVDTDIQINGETWLPPETITIEALNRDVTITMLNGPHIIHGTEDLSSARTKIVLIAHDPWKIEIIVDEDLTFVGPDNSPAPLIIQERANVGSNQPIIQWTVAEHKHLYFGPSDNTLYSGVDLQIVCSIFYSMPRHIFKVNGSSKNPHIHFLANSSYTIYQETSFVPLIPFWRGMYFDVSNGQPRDHLVYFKDGSSLIFESIPLIP